MSEKSKEKRKPVTFSDTNGGAYTLGNKIGSGGQGAVFETERPNVLVKFYKGRDAADRRRWVHNLNWILRQDLDGLKIARPRAVVERPAPGYVMELMDGLVPLQDVLERSFQSLQEGRSLEGFVETGGLRRRLALLRELSRTLADLHARGMAYGDLSPANIFVSEDAGYHQVWLIDCDNLCTSERPAAVHTPGYGAPEVLREQRPVNTLTDAWSFAVIAFELLTHSHPFVGAAVEDGPPEEEERAHRGELPWIYHPEDESNAAAGGLPLELVATPRMRALFDSCFNAGRDNPLQRPSAAEWADALDAAHAVVLVCGAGDCGSGFYWNNAGECSFCGGALRESSFLKLQHGYACESEELEEDWLATGDEMVLQGGPIALRAAPPGTSTYQDAPELCLLELRDDALVITPRPEARAALSRVGESQSVPITRRQTFNVAKKVGKEAALELLHTRGGPGFVWRFTW